MCTLPVALCLSVMPMVSINHGFPGPCYPSSTASLAPPRRRDPAPCEVRDALKEAHTELLQEMQRGQELEEVWGGCGIHCLHTVLSVSISPMYLHVMACSCFSHQHAPPMLAALWASPMPAVQATSHTVQAAQVAQEAASCADHEAEDLRAQVAARGRVRAQG